MTTGRKISLIAAALVSVVVLVLIGLHYCLLRSAAQYRAELIRKGERLRIDQVLPKRPQENGAPDLMGAIAQLPRYQAGVRFLDNPPLAMHLVGPGAAVVGWQQPDLRRRGKDQTNSWEELRGELGPLEPVVEELRAALQKPGFDFNINYSQGFSTPLLHLAKMKTGVRALSSSASLHLHDQKLDLALRDLKAELALCRAMDNEEFLISQIGSHGHRQHRAANDVGSFAGPGLDRRSTCRVPARLAGVAILRSVRSEPSDGTGGCSRHA